ncbi:MAG: AmmeMemoRadiSam system protein B [Anaerolineae bacterium]|nr:AmmeMemoRadiSam system protein B [Phycisphaerae bacterium]
MSGPKDDPARKGIAGIRAPAVAGLFYPEDPATCAAEAQAYVSPWIASEGERVVGHTRWIGGVVPHAGWVCSGAIAGQTIGTIAASRRHPPVLSGLPHRPEVARAAGLVRDDSKSPVNVAPDVVIVLGAVHTPLPIELAALDDYERWAVPNGSQNGASLVLAELRAKLLEAAGDRFAIDDRFHRREHAVEVELPLIAAAWPGSAIVPVEVPTVEHADAIGREIARLIDAMKLDAVILASSDLTHYGPAYRFAPAGIGLTGLRWAKENDRRLLDRIERLDVDQIVPEVVANFNACGGGAIAAMLSACRELGANEARVLHHANSYETLAQASPPLEPQPPDNAVGYASVVVG